MSIVKEFILKYIEKYHKLPEGENIDTFDFVSTGYIDSLALFKFIVVLEEEFDIEFLDEEIALKELKTIGGLENIIINKINNI